MKDYRNLISRVYSNGVLKKSRAGEVRSVHHEVIDFDLRDGFPAITGRKLAFDVVAAELECFIHGLTDIREFHARGCHIWDANLADFNARTNRPNNTDLGPIYGRVWRGSQPGDLDQLAFVLAEAKANPNSRRLLVSAWLPDEAQDSSLVALPACHVMWQLSIANGFLDLCFYMRSVDIALGLPFDVASYALLQTLIANELMLTPRKLTAFLADAHIYTSNDEGVRAYMQREIHKPPTLVLESALGAPVTSFKRTDVRLASYSHGEPIKMMMAV